MIEKREPISFFVYQGNLEVLKSLAKAGKPLQFKDLKLITNPKTSRKYSTRTIAESLKMLEDKKMIRNEVITGRARKAVGYILTDKGNDAMSILRETEEKLKKL
ncbi:MAG: winged-helix domain-containing protein [Nanoarchaeota archaeon]